MKFVLWPYSLIPGAVATIVAMAFYFNQSAIGGVKVNPKFITELVTTTFDYPNPYRLNFVAQYRFVEQVGEFLVRRDNFQNIMGGLAQSWTISKDRQSIVFHLRPNIYSAEEVAQSLRRLIRAKQTSHSNLAHQISRAEDIVVIDPLNLRVKTAGDAGAILAPLVMSDTVILPDDHWISLPGFDEPQVDWTKTKGPYIHESGSFLNLSNGALVYKPNSSHYFYSKEQLRWRIIYRPIDTFKDLAEFKQYFDREPTFTTMRYWELLKVFFTPDPGLTFYETRPNGVNFLIPNIGRKRFASEQARVAFLKRVLKARIPLLKPENRANQIPQPGLVGRLPELELKSVLDHLGQSPDTQFDEPIVWAIPDQLKANGSWVKEVANAIGLPVIFKNGPYLKVEQDWRKSEFDIMISSIGMSDTDPVSAASFLFSPTANYCDYEDGRILKLLNSAKDSTDREFITQTVRKAFQMALEGGLIIPLNYTTNRHYHSPEVELNIKDPFSESIHIWEVRLKD